MSRHLKDTIALCPTCYKHVDAEIVEENGKVYISRECEQHGLFTSLFENDVDFYLGQTVTPGYAYVHKVVAFDVTNRCNLTCPNCYQLPDDSPDKPEFDVLSEISEVDMSIPVKIMLAGAEVTMRKNLPSLMSAIKREYKVDDIVLLTNGVALSKMHYLEDLLSTGTVGKTIIGLNHWSYQGATVHKHQLRGIDNLNEHGIVPTVSYTLENFAHLDEVLEQSMDLFNKGKIQLSRIRPGAQIGRSTEEKVVTLSDTIQLIREYANRNGMHFTLADGENKPYHQNCVLNSMPITVEHWPNVTEIELHSCTTGPYARFNDGGITNYYHQIVLRDAYVNKKLPRLDTIPDVFLRDIIHGKPASKQPKRFMFDLAQS